MSRKERSPCRKQNKTTLRNLAMKGSREIILELYVGASENFFFLMKDLDYAYVNEKEPAEEKLVMQKSMGIPERGKSL